jgi:hypothetical protein
MKEIVEIFFGLTVGLPLAIIGIIGVIAIIVSGVASGLTLFPRGRVGQAVGVIAGIAFVLLMAFDVIPAARLAGVPLLLITALMTFVTHQRLARLPERIEADIPIAMGAVAGLVALAVPMFILVFKGIGG